MKHVFIVNPVSGKGKTKKLIPLIEAYFANHPGDYEIIVTTGVGDATNIAARYPIGSDVIIYSVGDRFDYHIIKGGLSMRIPRSSELDLDYPA